LLRLIFLRKIIAGNRRTIFIRDVGTHAFIMNREEYFSQYEYLISENILVTDKTDRIEKEIYENEISFNISKKESEIFSTSDFKNFLTRVKANRQNQLKASGVDTDLQYYIWFDEMAGLLRVNFINANHKKLPFGAELIFSANEDEIIQDFLRSDYLEGISWQTKNTNFENSDRTKSDDEPITFKQKVYKELIRK
jgi:hypothetical protein